MQLLHPFSPLILTQTAPTQTAPIQTAPGNDFNAQWQGLQNDLINVLPGLLGALVIFVVGVILAFLLASLTRKLLRRTNVDDRIAASVMGEERARTTHVENIFGSIVFWVVLVLAAVAALNVLNLNTVSQPLNSFLGQIFGFLPRLGAAVILGLIAWIVATLTKVIVIRSARAFGLDERLGQGNSDAGNRNAGNRNATTSTVGRSTTGRNTAEYSTAGYGDPGYGNTGYSDAESTTQWSNEGINEGSNESNEENRFLVSETLGNALYWFILLFFLPLILGVLNLQGPLLPVQNLLNDILAALPRILMAVLIGVAGWILARIVRGIITNLLSAAGTDRLGHQFGLGRTTGSRSLSWLLGTVVYVLILIPTAIAALDALQIQSISAPAIAMLNQILSAIPQIFTAALILFAGYFIGKFVADLVTNILQSIGFDNVFSWLGLRNPTRPGTSTNLYRVEDRRTPATEPTPPPTPSVTVRTPSEIMGIVVLVGIMLFATVAATNVLNIPGLSAIVTGLLIVFGQILVGLAIFAVGLYLANLAYNLISSSGGYQAQILGQIARVAIIALVAAMSLQQMGIASSIVNLAFGLLLGAIAVATAIAFGLGSREVAGEQTRRWLNNFQQNSNGGQREQERTPFR
ncbi:MAG: mechanosensitive ion channel [Oculatellaceae cyanobacterium Prado106]|nr:mechanosensitive ion channel [Oculatellaceae cyanobacterium Prado106]